MTSEKELLSSDDEWHVMIQVTTENCELDFAWKSMFENYQ